MFSDELINFLKKDFQHHLDEIGVALDLFIYSLNEAADACSQRGNELSKSKEYDAAIEFIKKASELHEIAKKMQEYMDILQLEDVARVSEDEILEDIEKKYPNYSEYEVDHTYVHNLHENFTHKRPYAFELKGHKIYANEWKNMFVETCNILAGLDRSLISSFPDNPRFNGRKSIYFTFDKPELMRSPKKLKDMDLYVETNFSANDIRNLIIKMISYYKIPLSEYKIYLRADYTELHRQVENNKADQGDIDEDELIDDQQNPVHDFTDACLEHIRDYIKKPLIRLSRAKYTTHDSQTKIVCLVSSERNLGRRAEYWFGFRVKQKEFMESAQESFVALGCGSQELIVLIPYSKFRIWLDNMSKTGQDDQVKHWHIVIIKENGRLMLRLKSDSPNINITDYIVRGTV